MNPMRWKQSLTPLDAVPDLDRETAEKLVENHITTAEELVGQIEAEPEGVRELLDANEPEVQELGRRARQVIDPEVSRVIEGQRGRKYKTGALPPHEEPT